ncbi:hypothetical protein CC80DRAFT_489952 [Byssothecium circinans]|uniref:Uncharacterized protein n=1 Tax=Byssothecium circinans TaxID=147558 RepID=A0A6A5U7S8_9PLEO|nr:hypothetical protein CC80DRAFT_489952 [Byssothecium circinans]
MVPTLPSLNSSAFLGLPLEIRQQVYRFCIPQNLCFTCTGDMYHQNRPKGWFEPPWRLDTGGANVSLEENDYPEYDSESVEVSSIDGEDSDKEEEYEASRLDDYCQQMSGAGPAR